MITRLITSIVFAVGFAGATSAYDLRQMVDLIERTPWGWTVSENVCVDDLRHFTFNDEMDVMYSDIEEFEELVVYRVHKYGPNSITMEIDGETRMTNEGIPVVWELRFAGPDALCWRATHWSFFDCSAFLVRCPEVSPTS